MSAFQTYQKTLKIGCDGVEGGRKHQTDLDHKISKALVRLADSIANVKCLLSHDAAGHFGATLRTRSCVASVQTQYGQNVAYVSGQRQSFVSYAIRAESSVPALNRAESGADHLKTVLTVLGALLGAGAFFGILNAIGNMYGLIIIPPALIGLSLVCGGWCGAKLGGLMGSRLEMLALRRVEKSGAASELDLLWDELTRELDIIAQPYEKV